MVLGKIGPHRWDWPSVGSNLFFVSHEERFRVVGLAFGLYCAGVTWSGRRDGRIVLIGMALLFFPRGLVVCFALSDPLTVDLKQLEHDRTCRLRLTSITK